MHEEVSHWTLMLVSIGFSSGLTALVAIMAFLIKRSIGQIDLRLISGDEKFKEINGAIAELKEKRGFDREYFAKEYVSKDDFIRDIHALDVKVDGVACDVKELRTGITELLSRQKEKP